MNSVSAERPHIEGSTLLLGAKPFTIVGAEIHNSSSSSAAAVHESFASVARAGANTVLAPLAWETVEPREGGFDFELLDTMIRTADEVGLRLVVLWFGTWKNATSSYVPSWVKRDLTRFSRSETTAGGPIEHLSPFSAEARDADANAFASMMGHIHATDANGTVIMVQIENEVGLLGDSRDRGVEAERAWAGPVPHRLLNEVRSAAESPVNTLWTDNGKLQSGTWAEVFGSSDQAHEVFMAWAYATFIEHIATRGRAEHDLPFVVNAWLDSPIDLGRSTDLALAGGMKPGDYPSGGPVAGVHEVWRAAAPSVDVIAPDIYFGTFDAICAAFTGTANAPLFIPEMRRSIDGVAQMFVALGEHHALGVSPFGVDSLRQDQDEWRALHDAYRLLRAYSTVRAEHPGSSSRGFHLTEAEPATTIELGEYLLDIKAGDAFGVRTPHFPAYGALVQTGPSSFVLCGRGILVRARRSDAAHAGIVSVHELADSGLEVTRRLNGDETGGGGLIQIPSVFATPFAQWPIPSITTGSGILRVELYSY